MLTFIRLFIIFILFNYTNARPVTISNKKENKTSITPQWSFAKTMEDFPLNMNQEIENDLQTRLKTNAKYTNLLSLLTFLTFTFFLVGYVQQMKHINKIKNTLKQETNYSKTPKTKQKKEVEIEKGIVNHILNGLHDFETQHGFLEQGMSLAKLSKKLNTNPSYLSKIVNTYKQKSFSNYLKELRLNYIISKLKTDKKLKLYTIKAIAQETGFMTAQSFTNAFHKKTGEYPSTFIKRLVDNY